MVLPDVKSSQLHQKSSLTLHTGEKLQQVTGCQTDKQGGYIYSWKSGIKKWGEAGDDNA